jgi:MFS superfamily sulfate permease-like transporter
MATVLLRAIPLATLSTLISIAVVGLMADLKLVALPTGLKIIRNISKVDALTRTAMLMTTTKVPSLVRPKLI